LFQKAGFFKNLGFSKRKQAFQNKKQAFQNKNELFTKINTFFFKKLVLSKKIFYVFSKSSVCQKKQF